jgi:RNA polymerase sigma-70 factor (ECF subfamily)
VRESDLEDLVHDVFLTLYRTIDRFDRSRPIKPWIFGIAFRVTSDHRRLARHKREVPLDDRDPADPTPLALEGLTAAEQRAMVQEALEGLSLEQRAVFVMHEIENLSIPEVAEALGVGHNTLYSRLRLAREHFERGVRRIASRLRIA